MFTSNVVLTNICYLAEIIPYHLIAYFPFRDRLRFPAWAVTLMVGLNLLAEFLLNCFLYSVNGTFRITDFLFAVPSMIIYFFCVQAEKPKLLFIYILIVDYIMVIRGVAIFIDVRFFHGAQATYSLVGTPGASVLRLTLFLVTVPFAIAFLNETKERVLRTNAPQIWRSIWLLPTLNTFIVLLFTYNLNMTTIKGLSFLLARICLLITIFIVYYMLISSLDSLRQQGEAEERARNQENMMALQRLQYSKLQRQIEETRQARHDLRQHLNMIQAYLNSGDQQALEDYIKKYGQKLPLDTWNVYCANYAVDTVVRYYAEQAEEDHIRFESQISLPQDLFVDEPDICVLLGNLLENAIDACRTLPDSDREPFIRIHAQVAGKQAISITVDNSCASAPNQEYEKLLSSKHPGFGTGTVSIRSIAQQYHGVTEFRYEKGVFYASVFLNP